MIQINKYKTKQSGHKFVALDVVEQREREQTVILSKHAQQVFDVFQQVNDIVKQQKSAADITGQSSSEAVLTQMRAIRDVIDRLIKRREQVGSLFPFSLFLYYS